MAEMNLKSLSGSYCRLLIRMRLAKNVVEMVRMKVRPSGGAIFTACAAMPPLAPGRFSTMTVCPVCLAM